MAYRGFAIMGWLMATAAHASIVINPVPAPIASGMTVALDPFAQAQASANPLIDGYQTRLQGLQPVPDNSGRLFVNDTRGTISVVGAGGGTPQTWFDIRAAVPGFSNASNPTQTG